MKFLNSNNLGINKNIKYHYVFRDLTYHKDAGNTSYGISKTNYFMSDDSFYQNIDMFQEIVDIEKFKDQKDIIRHLGKINQNELSSLRSEREELNKILKDAPKSDHIDSIINYHDELIGIFLEWFNIHSEFISVDDYIENKNKLKNIGGRPRGLTRRTIERYKKVFHQYEVLSDKYPSKTKTQLYELLATRDYDGKTYSRVTIRNIIEDKKYNLIPSR